MGLNISHDCWDGAYSAFSRWRNIIAIAAGYEICNVQYDNGMIIPTIMLDWGHITDDNCLGKWSEQPSDPLLYLIVHSDCDGIIKPEHARLLAKRLLEIVPLLPTEDDNSHIGNLKNKTLQFIAGLEDAANKNENVIFS